MTDPVVPEPVPTDGAPSRPRVRARRAAARPGTGRSGRLARVGAAVLTVALVTQPSAWAAPRVLPTPQAPVPAPDRVEELQPYVGQSSCSPFAKKGVRKFRSLILDTYDRGHDGGAQRACAVGGKSEHKEGRAWDWMLDARVKKDRKVANKVIRWLLAEEDGVEAAQARRLGVMYILWNHRMWSSFSGEWKRLSPGSHQHTDHVHFSFSWAGATGRTSFWTGKVRKVDYGPCAVYAGQPAVLRSGRNPAPCSGDLLTPPRTRMPQLWVGSRAKQVRWAQKKLGLARTGYFDNAMRKAVAAYQVEKGLPRTGVLDQPTWARLRPKSVTVPEPAGQRPTPAPSPTPSATPTPVPAPGTPGS